MSLNEFLNLKPKEISNLSNDDVECMLERLFKELEITLEEREENKQYKELINNMRLYFSHFSFFCSDKEKITRDNYLKMLFKVARNILVKTYNEQVKIFMGYIEDNSIPTKDNDINFSDIKEGIYEIESIYDWYLDQLVNYVDTLQRVSKIYSKEYPKAYKKMRKDIGFTLKMGLAIEAFVKYLEDNDILSLQGKITFGDIGYDEKKDVMVCNWFRNCLKNNKELFYSICNSYRNVYPEAIRKLDEYYKRSMKKAGSLSLSSLERIEIYMDCIENDRVKITKDTTFVDIDSSCQDKNGVINFVKRFRYMYPDEFLRMIEEERHKYPKAYAALISSYEYALKYNILSQEKKLVIYLRYIESNPFPSYNEKIKFRDIEVNIVDDTNIYSWSMAHVFVNYENILEIVDKYGEDYPIACKKIIKKMKEIIINREAIKSRISKEDKFRLFMRYINEYDVPTQGCGLRFCDIDFEVDDETEVAIWMRDRRNREEENFILSCAKYKDIYPLGYEKLMRKISELKRANYKIRAKVNK